MKKRGAILAVLILALLFAPVRALAQPPQEIVDGVQGAIDSADVGSWNETYSALPEDVKSLWGGKDLYALISGYALGEGEYLVATIQDTLTHLLKAMLPDVLPMIISLLAIAVLSGFLRAMSEANMNGVNEIAAFVC